MLMERKRFAAERAGAADKQSGGGSTGGEYAVFSLSHISRGTICSLPDCRFRIRAAGLFRAVCTSLSAANPALPFRLRRSCVSHGTSSGSAGPVAVSPASTAAALRPAARSFEKTPCLAPFLWYNCCEFTIRRRRSRPGRIGIAETAERLLWERAAPPSSRKTLCPQSLDTPAIQALPPQAEVVKKLP